MRFVLQFSNQLRTSCERNRGNVGAEGNPTLALKRSIDIGMQPNASGHQINYLEIYEPMPLRTTCNRCFARERRY